MLAVQPFERAHSPNMALANRKVFAFTLETLRLPTARGLRLDRRYQLAGGCEIVQKKYCTSP